MHLATCKWDISNITIFFERSPLFNLLYEMPQGIVKMGVNANIFDRHKGTKEQMCTFMINQTDHNISSNVKVLQINIYHCGIAFKSSWTVITKYVLQRQSTKHFSQSIIYFLSLQAIRFQPGNFF